MLEAGSVVSSPHASYRLLEDIGSGTFARCWAAEDLTRGGRVCLKEMYFSTMPERQQALALREASLHSRFHHRSIVGFIESFFYEEAGEAGGLASESLPADPADAGGPGDQGPPLRCLLIAMELMDCTLSEVLMERQERKSFLGYSELLEVFLQLSQGLAYLHSQGVIHRDISSKNVLVTLADRADACSSICAVKLCDFGTSRELSAPEASSDVPGEALAHTQIGTPQTMAPEVLQGSGYSEKADIWSLGCLFYETMCLRPLFAERNILSLFQGVQTFRRAALPEEAHKFYDRLSALPMAVINSMLSPRPQDRPSAEEISAALTARRRRETRGETRFVWIDFRDGDFIVSEDLDLYERQVGPAAGGVQAQAGEPESRALLPEGHLDRPPPESDPPPIPEALPEPPADRGSEGQQGDPSAPSAPSAPSVLPAPSASLAQPPAKSPPVPSHPTTEPPPAPPRKAVLDKLLPGTTLRERGAHHAGPRPRGSEGFDDLQPTVISPGQAGPPPAGERQGMRHVPRRSEGSLPAEGVDDPFALLVPRVTAVSPGSDSAPRPPRRPQNAAGSSGAASSGGKGPKQASRPADLFQVKGRSSSVGSDPLGSPHARSDSDKGARHSNEHSTSHSTSHSNAPSNGPSRGPSHGPRHTQKVDSGLQAFLKQKLSGKSHGGRRAESEELSVEIFTALPEETINALEGDDEQLAGERS